MPERTPDSWRKLADFLALRRNVTLLLAALVLAGTAERLWLVFVPKYLQTLGAGALIIGGFDALQTLLGALYAFPGGWLTDKLGQRRSLNLFTLLSVGGYALVLVWHHWLALMLGAFFFLAWSSFSLPATFSIVATSLERSRHTMGIGVQSMVRRVPMMIGPLAGGWLITHFGWGLGIRYALCGSIVLSGGTLIFQWAITDPRCEVPPGPAAARALGFRSVYRSFTPELKELLTSDILIRFCERIPYAWVIVWAMNHGGVSAEQFGMLVAIEMVTAVFCYVPVAHLADKHGQRPFVLATFIFFSLFPVFLLWADNFGWLSVAFMVRGLKEFGEPARKALIIAEARPEARGRTYGAYYLIRDCVVTTGAFLGAWLWHLSPRANFIGAALFGSAGTIWFWHTKFRGRTRSFPQIRG